MNQDSKVQDATKSATTAAATTLPTTTADGLQILEQGGGEQPGAMVGDVVSVHYRGRLTTGEEFDSSFSRGKPIQFPLGSGRVIKGWDLGIAGMKIGQKRQLTIPPALGYGDKGAGGVIPPNATLVFDVELMGIERPK